MHAHTRIYTYIRLDIATSLEGAQGMWRGNFSGMCNQERNPRNPNLTVHAKGIRVTSVSNIKGFQLDTEMKHLPHTSLKPSGEMIFTVTCSRRWHVKLRAFSDPTKTLRPQRFQWATRWRRLLQRLEWHRGTVLCAFVSLLKKTMKPWCYCCCRWKQCRRD